MAILGSQQRPSWRWLAAGAAIGLALVAAAWWVAPATGGHDAAAPAAEAARPAIGEAFFLRGVSEAQLEKVRRLRREIADAYRHKDFAYFGLAP